MVRSALPPLVETAVEPVVAASPAAAGKARRVLRGALIVLNGSTALTAAGGGLALATGMEGTRFPVELLSGTPFASYLVPGLILAIVVGGSAAVATGAAVRSQRLGARPPSCPDWC
jgi:hypothetical protein